MILWKEKNLVVTEVSVVENYPIILMLPVQENSYQQLLEFMQKFEEVRKKVYKIKDSSSKSSYSLQSMILKRSLFYSSSSLLQTQLCLLKISIKIPNL